MPARQTIRLRGQLQGRFSLLALRSELNCSLSLPQHLNNAGMQSIHVFFSMTAQRIVQRASPLVGEAADGTTMATPRSKLRSQLISQLLNLRVKWPKTKVKVSSELVTRKEKKQQSRFGKIMEATAPTFFRFRTMLMESKFKLQLCAALIRILCRFLFTNFLLTTASKTTVLTIAVSAEAHMPVQTRLSSITRSIALKKLPMSALI